MKPGVNPVSRPESIDCLEGGRLAQVTEVRHVSHMKIGYWAEPSFLLVAAFRLRNVAVCILVGMWASTHDSLTNSGLPDI
jgi:hypothetical protein